MTVRAVTEAAKRYRCADCQARPATVFLPEGRYLCWPCWQQLRQLRAYVVTESQRRRTPME